MHSPTETLAEVSAGREIATHTVVVPQDIVDQIIDELREDRETLKSCSLTHSTWLHRSRVYLHRSIALYHHHFQTHPTQLRKLYDKSTLSSISKYTEVLILEGRTNYKMFSLNEQWASRSVNEIRFWSAVSYFEHVTSLRVSRLSWPLQCSKENKQRLQEAFRNITRLDIHASDFTNAQEFLSFLSTFPALTRLEIRGVHWRETVEGWTAHSTEGGYLQELSVRFCEGLVMFDVAKWLSAFQVSGMVKLHLSPAKDPDFRSLSVYCDAVGLSLRHLILDIDCDTNKEDVRAGAWSESR